MNNEPVAWMWYQSKENTNPYTQMTGYSQLCFSEFAPDCNVVTVDDGTLTPLYTQEQLEEARKLGMQQERALWNLSESTQEIMNTHPHSEESVKVKELKQIKGVNYYVDESTIKNLTDEEIAEVYEKCEWASGYVYWKEFARAILRKAQEK